MAYSHIGSSHKKSNFFFANLKKLWIVQNSFSMIEKATKKNPKKTTKTIATLPFSTPYISIPHKLLINILNEIISCL